MLDILWPAQSLKVLESNVYLIEYLNWIRRGGGGGGGGGGGERGGGGKEVKEGDGRRGEGGEGRGDSGEGGGGGGDCIITFDIETMLL